MARTYKAEGRQVAYVLRGLFAIIALSLFYFIPGLHWGVFFGFLFAGLIVAEILGIVWTRSRRAKKKSSRTTKARNVNTVRNASKTNRPDDVILSSRLEDLSGFEFERLLALYFRAQGYQVKEVGVGGNDGGVDLVIIDRRGEKTAVQAKCYADHNKVNVQTVRELVAAKRNHDCILSLVVTTSDLTGPAKKEAEQFKVDYWHGALLEDKLKSWGEWQPSKKSRRKYDYKTTSKQMNKAKSEVAVSKTETKCECGSTMIVRKNRQGVSFLGCSRFPACRHTISL